MQFCTVLNHFKGCFTLAPVHLTQAVCSGWIRVAGTGVIRWFIITGWTIIFPLPLFTALLPLVLEISEFLLLFLNLLLIRVDFLLCGASSCLFSTHTTTKLTTKWRIFQKTFVFSVRRVCGLTFTFFFAPSSVHCGAFPRTSIGLVLVCCFVIFTDISSRSWFRGSFFLGNFSLQRRLGSRACFSHSLLLIHLNLLHNCLNSLIVIW